MSTFTKEAHFNDDMNKILGQIFPGINLEMTSNLIEILNRYGFNMSSIDNYDDKTVRELTWFIREIYALHKLSTNSEIRDFIPSLYKAEIRNKPEGLEISFEMEKVDGRSLYEYLEYKKLNKTSLLTEFESQKLLNGFLKLSVAIDIMHRMGILQRDLSYNNIIAEEKDNHLIMRLIDFGNSMVNDETLDRQSVVFSIPTLAPEIVFSNRNYSVYSESYSFMCLIIYSLFGIEVFHMNQNNVFDYPLRIKSGIVKFPINKELIKKILMGKVGLEDSITTKVVNVFKKDQKRGDFIAYYDLFIAFLDNALDYFDGNYNEKEDILRYSSLEQLTREFSKVWEPIAKLITSNNNQ